MHALGLPAASYLDPAQAATERERIFDRSWQFVCHASDLPAPGTAIRFDCAARSSVVMRGTDGALHGFRNACRHRGSRLIDGDAHTGLAFCVESRLRCPYHGWTYDQTGALVAIPEPHRVADFDAGSSTALHPVHVEQWRGLVFIALEPPALRLADALEPFVPAQAGGGNSNLRRLVEPRNFTIHADWKLASEHLLDLAHRVVARPTVKPQLFDVTTFTPCGPLAVRATGSIAEVAAAKSWAVRAYAQWLSEGAPNADMLFVWPNLLLQFAPDQLAVIQVLPGATGSCQLREVAYGTPAATRELRLVRYAHARARRSARAQDGRILERVQHGLASVSAAAGGGPIAEGEVGVQWFVECLRRAMTAPTPIKPTRQRLRKPALAIP